MPLSRYASGLGASCTAALRRVDLLTFLVCSQYGVLGASRWRFGWTMVPVVKAARTEGLGSAGLVACSSVELTCRKQRAEAAILEAVSQKWGRGPDTKDLVLQVSEK